MCQASKEWKKIESSKKFVSQFSLVNSICSFSKAVGNSRITNVYFAPCAHKGEGGAFVVEDGRLAWCGGDIDIWGAVIITGSRGKFRTQSNI